MNFTQPQPNPRGRDVYSCPTYALVSSKAPRCRRADQPVQEVSYCGGPLSPGTTNHTSRRRTDQPASQCAQSGTASKRRRTVAASEVRNAEWKMTPRTEKLHNPAEQNENHPIFALSGHFLRRGDASSSVVEAASKKPRWFWDSSSPARIGLQAFLLRWSWAAMRLGGFLPIDCKSDAQKWWSVARGFSGVRGFGGSQRCVFLFQLHSDERGSNRKRCFGVILQKKKQTTCCGIVSNIERLVRIGCWNFTVMLSTFALFYSAQLTIVHEPIR